MSNFIIGSSWKSYQDYLQAASFEDSVNGQIRRSSREIVATQEQLQDEHIHVTRDLGKAVEDGFENISWEMAGVREGITELTAKCEWGFSGIVASLGLVGRQVEDVNWKLEHPSFVQANEYYHRAKHLFERGLHKEALAAIKVAIDGKAGILMGNPTDFRYHYLLGAIYLGDKMNTEEEVLDLTAAEKAFVDAARYSRHDEPKEAARALVFASQSSYCRNVMKNAEKYARDAIALNQVLGAAHFQLAKVLMHENRTNEALPSLEKAIRLDEGYALTVLMDPDFMKCGANVDRLLESLKLETKDEAERALSVAQAGIDESEKLEIAGLHLLHFAGSKVTQAKECATLAKGQIAINTYIGYLRAIPFCHKCNALLREAKTLYVADAVQLVESWKPRRPGNDVSADDIGSSGGFIAALGALGIFIWVMIVGNTLSDGPIKLRPVGQVAGYILFATVVAFGIPGLIFFWVSQSGKQSTIMNTSKTMNKIAELDEIQTRIREIAIPKLPPSISKK